MKIGLFRVVKCYNWVTSPSVNPENVKNYNPVAQPLFWQAFLWKHVKKLLRRGMTLVKDALEIFRFVYFFPPEMCNQVRKMKSSNENLNGNCQYMSPFGKEELNLAELGMNGWFDYVFRFKQLKSYPWFSEISFISVNNNNNQSEEGEPTCDEMK